MIVLLMIVILLGVACAVATIAQGKLSFSGQTATTTRSSAAGWGRGLLFGPARPALLAGGRRGASTTIRGVQSEQAAGGGSCAAACALTKFVLAVVACAVV